MFLVRYGDHLLWADLADAEMWEQLMEYREQESRKSSH